MFAMKTLEQRDARRLRQQEGMLIRDIASILGVAKSSVKTTSSGRRRGIRFAFIAGARGHEYEPAHYRSPLGGISAPEAKLSEVGVAITLSR